MAVFSEFIYGGIFSAYVACFVFIGAYLLIRRGRIPLPANLELSKQQEGSGENDKKTK